MTLLVKEKNDRAGKRIEVDDTEIMIKGEPTVRSRPEYRCTRCEISFPSQLDLSEHEKIDHARAAVSS
jgi:hypothetical protein